MITLLIIVGTLVATILIGVICHWHLVRLIDKNVKPLTGPERIMVSRIGRLPLLEKPYSQTGLLANGDLIEEIRLIEERAEEEKRKEGLALPRLSTTYVTKFGNIVEDEP